MTAVPGANGPTGPSGPPEPWVPEGLEYPSVQALGRRGVWRPLVGVPLAGLLTFVVLPVLLQLPVALFFVLTGGDVIGRFDELLDLSDPTPASLAYLNIVLASAIPVTFLISRLLHGLRPGWLTSVRPRMRWGYFGICLVLAFAALFAALLVGALMPAGASPEGSEITGRLNPWTDTVRDFVLVVVLLTPLQAAGEEYLFRGYLTQACGNIFGHFGPAVSRATSVVVPALLFALAHGLGQSVPIFFDRFAFGLVAGVLVIVTGGLEAGIAMHVLNNLVAYGIALAYTDMGSTLNPTGGSWWMIPSTLAQSLVYLALAWPMARALRLQTTVSPEAARAALGPPGPPRPPGPPWPPGGPPVLDPPEGRV